MEISSKRFDVTKKISKILAKASNVLVPSTCLTCDRFVDTQGGCCPQCWNQLRFITNPLCPVMGSPFSIDMGEGFLSAEAIVNPPPFEKLRAVLIYDELARKLISSIKYSDRTDLLRWVANWMHVAGQEVIEDADMIVYTTGATSKAATRALKRGGASHINVLVFAKVETHPV